MLTVVAVTLTTVVTALVLTKVINIRRCPIGAVRIHVPHYTIAFIVGAPESIPNLSIRYGRVPLDDIVQGDLQLISCQSIG